MSGMMKFVSLCLLLLVLHAHAFKSAQFGKTSGFMLQRPAAQFTHRHRTVMSGSTQPFIGVSQSLQSNVHRVATKSRVAASKIVSDFVHSLPGVVQRVVAHAHPNILVTYAAMRLSLRPALQRLHSAQAALWRRKSPGEQTESWDRSALGFVAQRGDLLTLLVGAHYLLTVARGLLISCGLFVPDLSALLTGVALSVFAAQSLDLYKQRLLAALLPALSEDRRQNYLVNKSTSVALWLLECLAVCSLLAKHLQLPLRSVAAFGGLGGLLLGLATKDLAANVAGGLLLLISDPFTPGDNVTFRSGGAEVQGRVEAVGWTQTRVRDKDTRATYVPNAHISSTAVTNLERITHRKFETVLSLRYQDLPVVAQVVTRMRERLQSLPRLDAAGMPFRVNFVRVGRSSLEVEATCYFATRSLDEFFALQQAANLQLLAAIADCGAALALPASTVALAGDWPTAALTVTDAR